jgi:hypothetical protein
VHVAQYTGEGWRLQKAPVSTSGSFSTRWTVNRKSYFVAQVLGDADHAPAGTRALVVRIRGPRT